MRKSRVSSRFVFNNFPAFSFLFLYFSILEAKLVSESSFWLVAAAINYNDGNIKRLLLLLLY